MKWIAYTSNESGKHQVYIMPFNPENSNLNSSGKWLISAEGVRQYSSPPQWMNNGKSIYYFTNDNKIMAVDINEKASTLSPGKPYTIFDKANGNIVQLNCINKTGDKIIATVSNKQNAGSEITLIENWQKEVEKGK